MTVATALILHADGAEHAATIAGVFVAFLVLLGGRRLMALRGIIAGASSEV